MARKKNYLCKMLLKKYLLIKPISKRNLTNSTKNKKVKRHTVSKDRIINSSKFLATRNTFPLKSRSF